MAKKDSEPRVIENRKARFDYFIDETLEVGIRLLGSEVKAVRAGLVSLGEGYVRVQATPLRLVLHAVHVGEYGPAGPLAHAPVRERELLAHKREIARLAKAVDAKGVTVVPLKLYFKNGFAKLLIGVARGRTKSDKRDRIAERESQRDIDRAMSRRRE